MRILVVEDNLDWQAKAKEALADEHELLFGATFREAFEAWRSHQPDGIISDLFFPFSESEPLGQNGERLMALLEVNYKPGNPFIPRTFAKTGEPYAPLGLQLLGFVRQPIAFFSQGDRHEGAFGFVRQSFCQGMGWEAILRLFVECGGGADKADLAQWRAAVELLRPEAQAAVWRELALRQLPNYPTESKFSLGLNPRLCW